MLLLFWLNVQSLWNKTMWFSLLWLQGKVIYCQLSGLSVLKSDTILCMLHDETRSRAEENPDCLKTNE